MRPGEGRDECAKRNIERLEQWEMHLGHSPQPIVHLLARHHFFMSVLASISKRHRGQSKRRHRQDLDSRSSRPDYRVKVADALTNIAGTVSHWRWIDLRAQLRKTKSHYIAKKRGRILVQSSQDLIRSVQTLLEKRLAG